MEAIKNMKGHANSSVKDAISLPNGAIVTCGADKSIVIWEE